MREGIFRAAYQIKRPLQDASLPAIVYWLIGSFATATWPKLGGVVAITAAGGAVLCLLRFRINVLSLGDEEAQALGVPVEGLRWAVLLAVTAIVSGGVAVAGVVGWVGLVAPHLARMIVGPGHRLLLPASALVGDGYMVLVDTVARSLTVAEIPLGILTAIIGAAWRVSMGAAPTRRPPGHECWRWWTMRPPSGCRWTGSGLRPKAAAC